MQVQSNYGHPLLKCKQHVAERDLRRLAAWDEKKKAISHNIRGISKLNVIQLVFISICLTPAKTFLVLEISKIL